MHMPRLAVLLVAAFAACDGAPDAGDEEQTIQGGKSDKSDPAVGLVWFRGGGFCSGALIAPSLVLTAGHCVQDPIEGFYTGHGRSTRHLDARPPSTMVRHEVASAEGHPSYRNANACPNPTFDVGLVQLARPIDSIQPIALGRSAPSIDETCETIGFGAHGAPGHESYEAKRSATERVLAAGRTWLRVEAGTGIADHGDSGGPLVCGGRIVGVTSCHDDSVDHSVEYDARADLSDRFIAQALRR
jgi:hypothetical protein